MTSLNLFSTRFDQVMQFVEKRSSSLEYVTPQSFLAIFSRIFSPPTSPLLIKHTFSFRSYILIDTPGQIEVFTWSASGTIITELMASAFPTVVVYRV